MIHPIEPSIYAKDTAPLDRCHRCHLMTKVDDLQGIRFSHLDYVTMLCPHCLEEDLKYRGYQISKAAYPSPAWWLRKKYDFIHEEFDGDPDAHDHRCGQANSIEECYKMIDEIENENQ